MSAKNKKPVTVMLTATALVKLDQMAAERGLSRSSFVEITVRDIPWRQPSTDPDKAALSAEEEAKHQELRAIVADWD